jgi:AcrR family transcriptional regulator
MSSRQSGDAPSRSRQKRVGEALRQDTRSRLLRAAAQEFAAHGYSATTVARLAASADVSVQTLYLAWGSKRGLLRGYMDAALAGDSDTPYSKARPDMVAAVLEQAADDPRAIIRQISALYRQIAERAALGWRLYREAAASDAEIAADWQEFQVLRHQTFTILINHLPARSLRSGLSRAAAIDTAWTIASPDTYDLLVRTRGYTLDRYQKWVTTNLTMLLLEPCRSHRR